MERIVSFRLQLPNIRTAFLCYSVDRDLGSDPSLLCTVTRKRKILRSARRNLLTFQGNLLSLLISTLMKETIDSSESSVNFKLLVLTPQKVIIITVTEEHLITYTVFLLSERWHFC